MNQQIASERLVNQHLAGKGLRDPEAAVRWFGAVQAQEYAPAKWALGQRLRGTPTDASIARLLDEGRILRTHVLRPTWHFVTADDIHWMLELSGARIQRAASAYYRNVGLTDDVRRRAARIFERVLKNGEALTRAELGVALTRAGIAVKGLTLAYLTMHAELERVICSGPRRGNKGTYALLAARAPRARRLTRDEALGELTSRYFQSHAPATARDFAWWSGLTAADVKRSLQIANCEPELIDGLTYWRTGQRRDRRRLAAGHSAAPSARLLPIYDEYLVAYRDLIAVPRASADRGALGPSVIIDGRVVGGWKPLAGTVEINAARRISAAERQAVAGEVERYNRFGDSS